MITQTGSGKIDRRLAYVAGVTGRLAGLQRWLAGIGAGAATTLAMPPFFLWPVLFLTLPILVWLALPHQSGNGEIDLPGRRRQFFKHAAAAGWLFGFGFHVVGLYWLREAFIITGGGLENLWPLGVLGLPAGLALFHAAAVGCAVASGTPGMPLVVRLAIAIGIGEWLRGTILTGFPWNVLGTALTGTPILMQAPGLLGIYGLTVVTVLITATPGVVLASEARQFGRRIPRSFSVALITLAPLATLLLYGSWRLTLPEPQPVAGVRIRLVQPSIDQRDKWRADKQPGILQRHLDLTTRNAMGQPDGLAGITHVVWPEAAMPFLPLQRPEVMAAIAEALPAGVHLIAGIARLERRQRAGVVDNAIFNSLAVIDDAGRPVSVYDKTHLVPFGEYLPLRPALEALGLETFTRQRGGFESGIEPRPLLNVGRLSGIGPLICYEGIFPGISRRSAGRPMVMLNVTNDGWFGNSTGPRQHLHQARLRSVEEGVPLIRVANNGISAVYDSRGREVGRLELDVAGVIDSPVPGTIRAPPYAQFGDISFLLIVAGLTLSLWLIDQR